MKPRIFAAFTGLIVLTSILTAAEPPQEPLKLTDGRVFSEWRITGESAASVTVRYKGGVAQVSKKMLPEPLRSEYPIDKEQLAAERAADAEARRKREAKNALEAQARRELAARAAAAASPSGPAAQAAAANDRALYDRVFEAARARANRYFRYEFEPSGSSRIYSINVSVDADDPEPWPGIPGRYTVKGKGYLVYYSARGYSGFDRATKEFTAYVDTTQFGAKVVDFRTW